MMMKNLFSAFACSAIVMMSACSDDEGLQVQPHDENVMMNIMHDMMNEMEQTGDPDHDFAAMMRMHHQGAIDMAEQELASGNDDQMRSIAQRIIDEQKAEIEIIDRKSTRLNSSH